MTYQEVHNYLLKDRKLSLATIREHNIAFYSKKGYLYAPASYPKDFAQLQDVYSDSLIFPIYDLYGDPVGIMTRRMYPSKSKYVNSSNDNKFTKGKHLYGLHLSHSHILQANQAIVVEGIFDFLQLYQSGVKNVVSMMGVALSPTQIALLSRFTNNIVVLPDPDAAGDRFGHKSARLIEKYAQCSYVKLPENLDPDEYICKVGADKFREVISQGSAGSISK